MSEQPSIPADKFLFVKPHKGYDGAEASLDSAVPSLSRLELLWERLLRRVYFLGVVSGGGVSAANAAHADPVSVLRFPDGVQELRPDRTAADSFEGLRGQRALGDFLDRFNGFLRDSLRSFLVPSGGAVAPVDREWTSGVAWRRTLDVEDRGADPSAADPGDREWDRGYSVVEADPQWRLPPVPFRTLAEAWLRAPLRETSLRVSEGVPEGGSAPSYVTRTYRVPRWSSCLPEAAVPGVSVVDFDGERTVWGSVSGYGAGSDDFALPAATREWLRGDGAGHGHCYLAEIPARAPVFPSRTLRGRADVLPPPTVLESRYADEGWRDGDLRTVPARLRPSVEACFVPPALMPCLRADFPPPDGWCAGLRGRTEGADPVPYGDAASVRSGLSVLFRAALSSADGWLGRMSTTATTFGSMLFSDVSTSTEAEHETSTVDDWYGSSPVVWRERLASGGTGSVVLRAPGSGDYLGPGQYWSSPYGFGVSLEAPAASGGLSYSGTTTSSYLGGSTHFARTDGRVSWSVAASLGGGLPVWDAPYRLVTRVVESDGGSGDRTSEVVAESEPGVVERRVVPEWLLPFVRRAEVFVLAEVASYSPALAGSFLESYEEEYLETTTTPDGGGGGSTVVSHSQAGDRRSSEAVVRRILSLGELGARDGRLGALDLAGLLGAGVEDGAAAPLLYGGDPVDYVDDYAEEERRAGAATVVERRHRWTQTLLGRRGGRTLRAVGKYYLVADWDFDRAEDPFVSGANPNAGDWRDLYAARDGLDLAKLRLAEAKAELEAAAPGSPGRERAQAEYDRAGLDVAAREAGLRAIRARIP